MKIDHVEINFAIFTYVHIFCLNVHITSYIRVKRIIFRIFMYSIPIFVNFIVRNKEEIKKKREKNILEIFCTEGKIIVPYGLEWKSCRITMSATKIRAVDASVLKRRWFCEHSTYNEIDAIGYRGSLQGGRTDVTKASFTSHGASKLDTNQSFANR